MVTVLVSIQVHCEMGQAGHLGVGRTCGSARIECSRTGYQSQKALLTDKSTELV